MAPAMERAEVEAMFRSAALEAVQHYPLTATSVELVCLSENVTFRVDTDEGASYVLCLHRPGYHTLPELISERVWLRALADAGISAPVPVACSDGQDYVSVTVDATGEQRFVGLTHWVDGEIVSRTLSKGSDPAVVSRRSPLLGPVLGASRTERRLTVIDFDDAGFGWHQYDIAVALFGSAVTPNEAEAEAEAAFFTGYRSLRPLSEIDQALIPLFQLVRGMAVIGWKMQRPEVEWEPSTGERAVDRAC